MNHKHLETLSKLIPRLSSDSDHEVVQTVRAIQRTLEKADEDFYFIVSALTDSCSNGLKKTEHQSPMDHQRDAEAALRSGLYRGEQEQSFLKTMMTWVGQPTYKQRRWLDDILSRGEA